VRAFTLLLAFLAVLVVGAFVGIRLSPRPEPTPSPVVEPAAAEFESSRRVPLAANDVLPPSSTQGAQGDLSAARTATLEESPAATLPEERGRQLEDRWADLNRRAIRALEAGDHESACAHFEQCVKGVPDEPVFRRNLAEALARRAVARRAIEQPCAACIKDLERALDLVPDRADLAELLERWRSQEKVEAGFWRESSQHFELAYDGERSEILHGSHRLIEALEAAYTDLAEHFGTLPVEKGRPRIRVVLYRRAGFDTLTGLGDWAAGAFDGTVRIPVEDLSREERGLTGILRHELVHAFVLECGGPGVPGWLNEGLAQWLEPERESSVTRARAKLAGHQLFTLTELGGSLARWKDSERIERAYAQSLSFLDYLARQYGERVAFALVAGCKRNKPPEQSFLELTRVPLEAALADFEGELTR
jgi:hypothetical protein